MRRLKQNVVAMFKRTHASSTNTPCPSQTI